MEVKLLNSAINHCFFVLLLLLSFQDSPRLHLVIITDLINKRIYICFWYDYSNIGYILNLFICEYATICQNGFCDKVTIQLFASQELIMWLIYILHFILMHLKSLLYKENEINEINYIISLIRVLNFLDVEK